MDTSDKHGEARQLLFRVNCINSSSTIELWASIRDKTCSTIGGSPPADSLALSEATSTCNCCPFCADSATVIAAKLIASAISDLSSSVKALSPSEGEKAALAAAWEKSLKDLPKLYGRFRS